MKSYRPRFFAAASIFAAALILAMCTSFSSLSEEVWQSIPVFALHCGQEIAIGLMGRTSGIFSFTIRKVWHDRA
jgi:hypothetical protein